MKATDSRLTQKRNSALLTRIDWQLEISATRGSNQFSEYWGEFLRDKERQKDPNTADKFYTEMKIRLMRRFGTITRAFKEIDVAGDGSINFVEFDSMLHLMHLPLENRACRWIFTVASGGDREISLNELRINLLKPTMRKLKTSFWSYKKFLDRVFLHIQSCISQMMESTKDIRVAAVDRFQRRMKLPFCQGLFERVVAIPTVNSQMHCMLVEDVSIERTELADLACSMVAPVQEGGMLLECQVPLLTNVFARVGSYKGSAVLLVELMIGILLLSPDVDRCGKLKLLFDVFDSDNDHVLDHQQITEMFVRICKARPLFDGNPLLKEEGGTAFQEELSEQEGLRNYEFARWRLAKLGFHEGTVYWTDLWAAISDQTDVVNSLAPYTPLIRWAIDPVSVQIEAMLPSTVTPRRRQRHVAELVAMHPVIGDGWLASLYGKKHVSGEKKGHRQERRRMSTIPVARGQTSANKAGMILQDERNPQTSEYRKDLTRRFQLRLRRLGDQRITELAEGFELHGRGSPFGSEDEDTLGSVSDFSTAVSRPASALRPGSAVSDFSTVQNVSRPASALRPDSALQQGTLSDSSTGWSRPSSALRAVAARPLMPATLSRPGSTQDWNSSGRRRLKPVPKLLRADPRPSLVQDFDTTSVRTTSASGMRSSIRVSHFGFDQERVNPTLLPNLRKSSSVKENGEGLKELQRSSSVPGTSVPDASSQNAMRSSRSSPRLDTLPLVDSLSTSATLRWGTEAAYRHKLLVAARCTCLQECSQGRLPPAGGETFGYTCRMCLRKHELNPVSET